MYHEENNWHQKVLPIDGSSDGQRILAVAEEKGMINWKYGAEARFFFPLGFGGGEGVGYGYKSLGILIHSITDANRYLRKN